MIGSVLRHGYKLGDAVLRHALVGVVDTVDEAAETVDAAAGEATETQMPDTADNDSNTGEQNAQSEPAQN